MKCDCGELDKPHHAKEKCIHLRDAEERAKAGFLDENDIESDANHLAAVAEEQGCCCHHGGKCTCSIQKREPYDSAMAPHGPAVKPRFEKTISDGAITVFANGHHKPVHRKNHAAHECGMPYKMPMSRHDIDQHVSATARRSVDSLALDSSMPCLPSAFAPQTSAPFNTGRRMSKSEQHSPKIPAMSAKCNGLGDGKLASIDFSSLAPVQTNSTMQSASSDAFFQFRDPMSGITDASFDPWSALPSADSTGMPNNNPFGVWPTSGDSANMQPALTAASSNTHSEIDEMPSTDEAYGFSMPSIQEDMSDFNFENFASGNSPQFNRRSLPPGFFGNNDFGINSTGNGLQASPSNFNSFAGFKPQSAAPTTYSNMWQMPTLMSVPQRALGDLHPTSRPQSRSVGSYNAPNDDAIMQLFPGLDVGDGNFATFESAETAMNMDTNSIVVQKTSANSIPIDFGPMDETVGFTSHPWTDGSLNIPNDPFTSSYDLEPDYSNSDFSNHWSQ